MPPRLEPPSLQPAHPVHLPTTSPTRAVWVVLFANVLGVLFGVMSGAVTRWAGLEWLVSAGYIYVILDLLLIAVLVSGFATVRQTISEGVSSLRTYPVLRALAVILSIYASLLLMMLVARLTIGAYAAPPHFGWQHYLSLPAEARPGFLLHYMLLTMFAATLLGPIMEELLFIGANIRSLQSAGIARVKILIINATLFVLLHQLLASSWLPWWHLLSLAAGRMLLDTFYRRTGSIAVPICFHCLHNTAVMMRNLLPFL